MPTLTPYLKWLQTQGVSLFASTSAFWRLYNGTLVPATAAPVFIEISRSETRSLLKESGAWLMRYTSHPSEQETAWWYVVCDAYDPVKLTSKVRNQIRHGSRNCRIERIDTKWFSEHGYAVYRDAYRRYRYGNPLAEQTFRHNVVATQNGPVEYWGGFVGDQMVAYSQCTIEGDSVDTTVTRFSPDYLRLHIAHAMINALILQYVVNEGKVLCNGERSVVHPTNFQEFLIRLGFRKQFCRLNVEYRWWLGAAVKGFMPLRNLLPNCSDSRLVHKIGVLVKQEEIRKSCV